METETVLFLVVDVGAQTHSGPEFRQTAAMRNLGNAKVVTGTKIIRKKRKTLESNSLTDN